MTTKTALPRNQLLVRLPPEEIKRLLPHLKLVRLPLGRVLYKPGKTIEYAYFPDDAVISLLTTLKNGRSVEVTLIGNEGVLGIPAALGAKTVVNPAVAQVPGTGWRIKAATLRSEFQRGGVLHERMLAYTLRLLSQISRTAACNRVHELEQRFARWLLMVFDRTDQLEFPMTDGFLSHMLGTSSSQVTAAAGAFRKAGLIDYKGGRIKILKRKALESMACECYRADLAN